MSHELIAAVDLGSNSFRLQVGRIVDEQIFPLDSLKESVCLAGGLSEDKMLDAHAIQRGVQALHRFYERLADFPPESVRAVGTNTLRVAKNAGVFLHRAEAALGFPIEIIAGREEARLIYVGVTHTLPDPHHQQLVVDIGGGSTEFIIGEGNERKFYDQPHGHGVEFLGSHIRPNRIHLNDKTYAQAVKRIRELNRIANKSSFIDPFLCSVNSYFGLLKQRTDYRRMLALRDMIDPSWWEFVRWDDKRKCVTAQPYWTWRSRMDRKYHLNLKHYGKRRTRPAA